MNKEGIGMNKVITKLIIAFLIIVTFLLLFGKTLFMYVMGFLFLGSPFDEFTINHMGNPLVVGESWNEEEVDYEDYFQVTVADITSSEENGQYLYDITIIAENYRNLGGNEDLKVYCEIDIPKRKIITEETPNYFTVPEQQIKEYHYKFFLGEEISNFNCEIEIPLHVDERHKYKKIWNYSSTL